MKLLDLPRIMARLSLLLLLLLCSFKGLSQETAMEIAAGQFIKMSGARSAEMKKITDMYKINVRKANMNRIISVLRLFDNP